MQLLYFRILVRLFPSRRDKMLIKNCHMVFTFSDSSITGRANTVWQERSAV